ncbi:hypothetical protein K0B03_00615 [Patescibacteria group bacterium]|nr:hypothetical protein [Patescibacteria group bacterium]
MTWIFFEFIYGGIKYFLERRDKKEEIKYGKMISYDLVVLIVLLIVYAITNPYI